MNILVLDTVHGGLELTATLRGMGHFVDIIDVYWGRFGIDPEIARERAYDIVVAPVHLDPGYPLFKELSSPVITHHQAVRWILGKKRPGLFIEITGARGKTTTAFALAHLLPGPGILHTSMGTFQYPEKELLWKKSITPASVIPACREAVRIGGWLIAEVSLGFTGSASLGIITSPEDYRFAGGKRQALAEKVRSGQGMPVLITAPGIDAAGAVKVEDVVKVRGESCSRSMPDEEEMFKNPLLPREGYRVPLMLAAAAGWMLGFEPAGLASFQPLEGRMDGSWHGSLFIVDNSNSGTNKFTTLLAAGYGRDTTGKGCSTLVIGKEDGAVCEGFPLEDVEEVIETITPVSVILVGQEYEQIRVPDGVAKTRATSLEEGRDRAIANTSDGTIILSVKCWR
jgi:plasmid stability protein